MNTLNAAPLVFFQVLADRNGVPAALLFQSGPGPVQALTVLAEDEAFDSLSAQFPCLYPIASDAALAEALNVAGWKALDTITVHVTDEAFSKDLPPQVAWVGGAWCMTPPLKAQGPQAASRALALQLVQKVAADADTHEIEALLRQDPTLSYHLLRLVNSLGMGTGRKITSFSQAILILGRQQLRRWLNLMLFAARQGDVRSPMLLARVAVRARMLELLAKARGLDRSVQEQGFMAGMFSLLGVLFGMPLDEVLAPLAISEAVAGALLRQEGELGDLLKLVELAEAGQFEALAAGLAAQQISREDFNDVVVDAFSWMLGVVKESLGSGHG
ncbi:EAL and HDOD domain-containing protein [Massilia sp. TS11]|uniref:EAL and HDOD domain-containing protein n=1 Tax=Massilia sp. TS11 TaxID=2908003 RepID=UPI001EDB4A81|nr:HDOD domain-containing protein [Massilia sp. TS11]MCG2583265.1 HDOD domain-containing protein [Massilia sp. TS11]